MILVAISLVACTSEDAAPATDFTYLPLAVTNSWNYNVTTGTQTTTEVLKVASSSGANYTLLSNPTPANGVMTNLLTSGTLSQSNGKLIMNGTFSLANLGVGALDIIITDGVINDQNASSGTITYTTNGTFSQTVNNFPLNVTYTASNVQRADLASMNVNGITYLNVEHTQLIINAKITSPITVAGISQNITLMRAQDIVVIDNYWARDTGLIKSDNQFDYMLEDFSAFGINLPVPQAASILSEQSLTGFVLN